MRYSQRAASFLIFWVIFLFLGGGPVHAATVYVNADTEPVPTGGFFRLDVFLNTQEEVVNAVEGEILIPRELISIVDVRTGGTMISFWVEQPAQTDEKTIRFAGILPGGYQGQNAYLFSVIAEVNHRAVRQTYASPNKGRIEVQNLNVLLHDGKGSKANVFGIPYTFTVSEVMDDRRIEIISASDNEPPEVFQPDIVRDPGLHGGDPTLIFSTQDKNSGVSHYEILTTDLSPEMRSQHAEEEHWIKVSSPHVISAEESSDYLYVKAVDKAGNERIATVVLNEIDDTSLWVMLSVLLALSLIAIVSAIVYKETKQKS